MPNRVSTLPDQKVDLLVVGGGIHGLFAAYDAASRGLSVALVERGDF
jgi:glycerol-3-phosphate dehydrogenase